jgi:hypothetical protein
MNAYRIHHVARLLLNPEGRKIIKEYVNLKGSRIIQYSSLSYLLSQNLDDAQLSWNDWNRFKANPDQYILEPLFQMNENSKKKDDWQFSFKALSLVQGNNMSNFMFADGAAPMADGLARFLIKARINLIYPSVKKLQIFHQGDGHCELCGQIGTLKHYLHCFRNKFTRFTERHDAGGRVICQAINLHCIQDVI